MAAVTTSGEARTSGIRPARYRNGYEQGRLRTAEGEVSVRVAQVRGASTPYRSRLMEFLSGHSEALERLVVEMYARGLSTRDVEELRSAFATRVPVSS